MPPSDLPILARVVLLEREFREFRYDFARRLEECEGVVDGLRLEDKVARGVAEAMRKRGPEFAAATGRAAASKMQETGAPVRLTFWQKIGGSIAGALFVFDAVEHALRYFHP